jgi:hypothetical protein
MYYFVLLIKIRPAAWDANPTTLIRPFQLMMNPGYQMLNDGQNVELRLTNIAANGDQQGGLNEIESLEQQYVVYVLTRVILTVYEQKDPEFPYDFFLQQNESILKNIPIIPKEMQI